MNLHDWKVYVRTRTLAQVGMLAHTDLTDLTFSPTASGVGVWSITLPATTRDGQDGPFIPHKLCQKLREDGAGIVITYRDVTVFSGPMDTATETITPDHPDGLWTMSGPSDEVILEDALAWPDPAMATPQQARYANDNQKGAASTLIWSYVHRNIGTGAFSSRRGALTSKLLTSAPAAFGAVLSMSPRYQNLLELCQEIAAQGKLVFRILDEGGKLMLRIFQGRDQTRTVRWTVNDGFLENLTSEVSAPGVTRPIVAGQGAGEVRTVVTPTTMAALEAEERWGRKIEAFVDQRNTDDMSELTEKGLETIGAESAGLEVKPSPQSIEGWPEKWTLGDLVAVRTASHGDLVYPVTEIPITIGPDGVKVSAVLGSLTDGEAQQRSTGSRLSNLERNTSVPSVADTPWAALSINTALVQVHASRTPQWRIFSGKLYLRGAVTPKTGSFTNGYMIVLPAGAIPNLPVLRDGYHTTRILPSAGGNLPLRSFINGDGSMSVAVAATSGTAPYCLLNSEYIYE